MPSFLASLNLLALLLLWSSLPLLNVLCFSVGSTHQSSLNWIILPQKKIIRVMSKVPFDSHPGVLFKEQEILKFSDIC